MMARASRLIFRENPLFRSLFFVESQVPKLIVTLVSKAKVNHDCTAISIPFAHFGYFFRE